MAFGRPKGHCLVGRNRKRLKLDYLKEGSDECPLVRIYDFDSTEIRRLHRTFESLADGSVEEAQLEGVESVDGTQITFRRSMRDRGIIEANSGYFEVALAPEGWRLAADLTEPLYDGGVGYQWLVPKGRGIQLLLSKDGAW